MRHRASTSARSGQVTVVGRLLTGTAGGPASTPTPLASAAGGSVATASAGASGLGAIGGGLGAVLLLAAGAGRELRARRGLAGRPPSL